MDMLESIKMELDGNDLLLEDFPEVVYPIQALDGIANRCNGQLYQGEADAHRLDRSRDRAPHHAWQYRQRRDHQGGRHHGSHSRHEVQAGRRPHRAANAGRTRRSADRRIGAVALAVRHARRHPGRRGPRPGWSRQEDLRHHALHRDSPERHGRLHSQSGQAPGVERRAHQDGLRLPRRTRSSGQRYAEIRAEGLRQDVAASPRRPSSTGRTAPAMDEGAVIAWPERFNHDELSAVQHAMNLRLQNEAAFFAEYQNEPLPAETAGDDELTPDQIAAKLNRMQRAARDPDRLQPRDDVRRRAGHAALLRGRRLGGRLHRLRDRLRHVSRSAAAVLHAAGRAPDAGHDGDEGQPGSKGRSTPAWINSLVHSSPASGGATTAPCCGSNAA